MAEEIDLKTILNPDLPEREAAAKIAEYCTINTQDLETALARQASLYSYAVAGHEIAEVDQAKAKFSLDKAKATSYGILLDQKPKAPDTILSKEILTLPLVTKAQDDLIRAMGVCARLKALVSGLEHRKDMLVQISAKQRRERE